MIDIQFYMKVFELKKRLMRGEKLAREEVEAQVESFRSQEPVVYNIETTNACNMRCQMCPRTTMMTRPIETMPLAVFEKIIGQLRPYSAREWADWEDFAPRAYGVPAEGMSENHFFLYIIPRVIVLHGYGDPLLDRDMPARVRLMTKKGIPSYFSCNPANINLDKCLEMFESGLGYIKFSVESVDDESHKKIRGPASNFRESFKKIDRLLEARRARGFKTEIVITMLDLNLGEREAEFARLKQAFAGRQVYLYLKSQDQKWYQEEATQPTRSIHWTEFCQFPWSSMTIKSDGMAVECVEDFNNEIILGDAKQQTLREIWNGQAYRRFRQDHFNLTPGIKCSEQCDMKLLGSFFR